MTSSPDPTISTAYPSPAEPSPPGRRSLLVPSGVAEAYAQVVASWGPEGSHPPADGRCHEGLHRVVLALADAFAKEYDLLWARPEQDLFSASEMQHDARALLGGLSPSAFPQVKRVVDEVDLMGLLEMGAPLDEVDMGYLDLARLFPADVLLENVRDVWGHWSRPYQVPQEVLVELTEALVRVQLD